MKEWAIARDIRQILSDDGGILSSMRVCFMGWFAVYSGSWCYLSIIAHSLQPISVEAVGMMMAFAGAKTWQKRFEDKVTPAQ
jgi:hypothetical protein